MDSTKQKHIHELRAELIPFIIQLYDDQPIASDKLAGTRQLHQMAIAVKNKIRSDLPNLDLSAVEIWIQNELITLRKAGKLPPKGR